MRDLGEEKDLLGDTVVHAEEAAARIRRSGARYGGVTFIKADGSVREMWFQYGRMRPVKEHVDRPGCLTVWDRHKEEWRSIPIARLLELRMDGTTEEVE